MANRGIWFPAKRYGWGWGPPVTWQGWVVLIGWVALFVPGVFLVRGEHPVIQAGFFVLMVAVLIGVCWWKGERPRWRWGRER